MDATARTNATWPDGMSEVDAVNRLQSIMLAACEGNQDLSRGRDYVLMRRLFLARPDFQDVVPGYVRSHRDLGAFWTYIKGFAPKWETRRRHVYETFQPLFDRAEGLTSPPVQSGKWTGRRTAQQQAKVVLALGYDALAGIEVMLDDFEHAHHNGGPVSPAEQAGLEALKRLHLELGNLIALAQQGAPLGNALQDVQAASKTALRWSKSPIGFSLATLPLTGASTAIGVGVMYLVNAIAPGSGAAIGAAAAGVHVASAAIGARAARK